MKNNMYQTNKYLFLATTIATFSFNIIKGQLHKSNLKASKNLSHKNEKRFCRMPLFFFFFFFLLSFFFLLFLSIKINFLHFLKINYLIKSIVFFRTFIIAKFAMKFVSCLSFIWVIRKFWSLGNVTGLIHCRYSFCQNK